MGTVRRLLTRLGAFEDGLIILSTHTAIVVHIMLNMEFCNYSML